MKSQCCTAEILHFGQRRRQCSACKKTWRIRLRKRGRKSCRKNKLVLDKVLAHDQRIRFVNSKLDKEALKKRFQKSLNSFVTAPRKLDYISGKFLSLIIDAQHRSFRHKDWTLYFVGVKSCRQNSAIILDPILLVGKEDSAVWMNILNSLPANIRKRVKAVISDGINGLKNRIKQGGWLHQRCHYHMLAKLQKVRGFRKNLKGKANRENIYHLAKNIISNIPQEQVEIYRQRLLKLIRVSTFPRYGRMTIKDLLRHLDDFRLYLSQPEWRLPTTSNMAESLGSRVRTLARKINSPKALQKWSIGIVRKRSKFICKRANYQPN